VYGGGVKTAVVVKFAQTLVAVAFLVMVLASGGCGSEKTTSRSEAGVGFDGDFETGDRSQWNWGAQCANTGTRSDATVDRGNLFVQSEIVASGRYAARFDLPASTSRTACEALRKREIGLREEWYALSLRFPSNFATVDWGLTVAQFNYQRIWGPPLQLIGQSPNDATREANHLRLVAQGGLCRPVDTTDPRGPGCEWSSGAGSSIGPWRIIPPTRFVLGVWHDVLVHVVWTTDSSKGLIEGWHRQRGGTWVQTVAPFRGKPTVQWTATRVPSATDLTSDKIGAYRGDSTAPLSVWHDNFCVATTRAAAESCL